MDGIYVKAKQKGNFHIRISGNNGNPFIAALHNILLALDLCDKLFSIITLMNLGIPVYLKRGFKRCTSEIKRKMR